MVSIHNNNNGIKNLHQNCDSHLLILGGYHEMIKSLYMGQVLIWVSTILVPY